MYVVTVHCPCASCSAIETSKPVSWSHCVHWSGPRLDKLMHCGSQIRRLNCPSYPTWVYFHTLGKQLFHPVTSSFALLATFLVACIPLLVPASCNILTVNGMWLYHMHENVICSCYLWIFHHTSNTTPGNATSLLFLITFNFWAAEQSVSSSCWITAIFMRLSIGFGLYKIHEFLFSVHFLS